MTQIKESNSIFTELNSEDAASINGGVNWDFDVTEINGQPNHYLVKKFVNGVHRWTATVNNCGTVNKLRDDIVSFEPTGPQPNNCSYARQQAKNRVQRFINGC